MLAYIFSLCQNSEIEITYTYTYQMTFCNFSIKFLLPLNTSLQRIRIPIPSFLLTVLPCLLQQLCMNLVVWTEKKKAFSGSIRHVNFSSTKGIQILLHLWHPMIWDTIRILGLIFWGNFPHACSEESIFDFSFGKSSEILFTALQHSLFVSALFFAFKKYSDVFFFAQFEHVI